MIELAASTTWRDLVPGSPQALWDDGKYLRDAAAAFEHASDDLKSLDVGPWQGHGAEAFESVRAVLRARLVVAAEVYLAAGNALNGHGDVLAEAQRLARSALRAYRDEDACFPPGHAPAPTAGQVQAMQDIARAVAMVRDSAAAAARVLREARAAGPAQNLVAALAGMSDNPWDAEFNGFGIEMLTVIPLAAGVPRSGGRGPALGNGGAPGARAAMAGTGAEFGALGALSAERVAHFQRLANAPWAPPFLRRMFEGSAFNWANYDRYAAREVLIQRSDGRQFRLDSYTPGQWVVSRRYTQLSEVAEGTARRYMDEIVTKYNPRAPELTVADTPFNRQQLGQFDATVGRPLAGRAVFEVPVQAAPVPSSVLQYAAERAIIIRDPAGTVYRIGIGGPTP